MLQWLKANPLKASAVAVVVALVVTCSWAEVMGGFDERCSEGLTERSCPESDWWGVPLEGWIAIFTVLLTVSTVGLWRATFRLGERADEGMRTLERAYIYPVLHGEDSANIMSQLDRLYGMSGADYEARVALRFALRNLGKTPGTVTALEADLRIPGEPFDAQQHIISRPLLGANESTEDLEAVRLIRVGSAARMLTEVDAPKLIFQGFVSFVDIWGDEHTTPFLWRFDRKKRRLVPVRQDKTG